jgi:hypothetical protein
VTHVTHGAWSWLTPWGVLGQGSYQHCVVAKCEAREGRAMANQYFGPDFAAATLRCCTLLSHSHMPGIVSFMWWSRHYRIWCALYVISVGACTRSARSQGPHPGCDAPLHLKHRRQTEPGPGTAHQQQQQQQQQGRSGLIPQPIRAQVAWRLRSSSSSSSSSWHAQQKRQPCRAVCSASAGAGAAAVGICESIAGSDEHI